MPPHAIACDHCGREIRADQRLAWWRVFGSGDVASRRVILHHPDCVDDFRERLDGETRSRFHRLAFEPTVG